MCVWYVYVCCRASTAHSLNVSSCAVSVSRCSVSLLSFPCGRSEFPHGVTDLRAFFESFDECPSYTAAKVASHRTEQKKKKNFAATGSIGVVCFATSRSTRSPVSAFSSRSIPARR